MLSRLARAPRIRVVAAQFSQAVPSPVLRRRQAPVPISSWMRTFASNKNSAEDPKNHQRPISKQSPEAKSDDQPASSNSSAASEPAQASKDAEPIPFHKLPDLTQGIPSTLDQELRKSTGKSQSALQEVEQDEDSEDRRRERREYVSTSDRNRKWWTRFLLLATGGGGVFGILYMGRDWQDAIEAERHSDSPNGWSPALWWQRARARWTESVSYYQDPAFEKLLPDPDPSFERPYTLCLSLDDLLVHSEWSREHGWRVAKRPGMDYFVRYLSQYYELVLFTTVPFAMGEPIVRKLDPFRFIMWPLYREATKYEDGEIVKV